MTPARGARPAVRGGGSSSPASGSPRAPRDRPEPPTRASPGPRQPATSARRSPAEGDGKAVAGAGEGILRLSHRQPSRRVQPTRVPVAKTKGTTTTRGPAAAAAAAVQRVERLEPFDGAGTASSARARAAAAGSPSSPRRGNAAGSPRMVPRVVRAHRRAAAAASRRVFVWDDARSLRPLGARRGRLRAVRPSEGRRARPGGAIAVARLGVARGPEDPPPGGSARGRLRWFLGVFVLLRHVVGVDLGEGDAAALGRRRRDGIRWGDASVGVGGGAGRALRGGGGARGSASGRVSRGAERGSGRFRAEEAPDGPRVRFGVRGGSASARAARGLGRGGSRRGARGDLGVRLRAHARVRGGVEVERVGLGAGGRGGRARAGARGVPRRPPPGRPRRRLSFSRTRHRVARRAEARRGRRGRLGRARGRARARRGLAEEARDRPAALALALALVNRERNPIATREGAALERLSLAARARFKREPAPRTAACARGGGKRRPRRRARVRRRALAFARNARGRRAAARACGTLCARGDDRARAPGVVGVSRRVATAEQRAFRIGDRAGGWLAKRASAFFSREPKCLERRAVIGRARKSRTRLRRSRPLSRQKYHTSFETFRRSREALAGARTRSGTSGFARSLPPSTRSCARSRAGREPRPGRARAEPRRTRPLVGPRPPWNGSPWRRNPRLFPPPAAAPVAPPAPAT